MELSIGKSWINYVNIPVLFCYVKCEKYTEISDNSVTCLIIHMMYCGLEKVKYELYVLNRYVNYGNCKLNKFYSSYSLKYYENYFKRIFMLFIKV